MNGWNDVESQNLVNDIERTGKKPKKFTHNNYISQALGIKI
jgi:hypothetical protein